MSVLIFGGGDIATRGIIPWCGGVIADCDVRDYAQVRAAVAEHQAEVVVNCAGVSHPGPLVGDRYGWLEEIETNLVGSYNVARAFGDATFIVIASVAGLYGKPNHSGYCASKAGVISLVQSCAMEGRDAYAISPGRVDTRMRERDFPGEDPRTRLTPRQVGEVVAGILAGEFEPGDNIIIRKIGFETFLRVDRGEPWRDYLNVVPS